MKYLSENDTVPTKPLLHVLKSSICINEEGMMKNKKYGLGWMLLLVLLLLYGCGMQKNTAENISIVKGGGDLCGWSFAEDGVVRLDGDWEFFWERLIPPGGAFDSGNTARYLQVPQIWGSYRSQDFPSKGQGTYRLILKTDGSNKHLSLLVPEIYTEYALWVNGVQLHSDGIFAGGNATYLHPAVYDFDSSGTKLEIVLQIRNVVHAKAGISRSLLMGTTEQIHSIYGIRAAVDLFLFSVCLIAGLYHLILFHYRKKDKELIFFCCLCLLVSIRSLFSNTTLVMQVFTGMPFWLGSKLFNFTVPLILLALLEYSRSLFPEDYPKAAFRVFSVLSGAYLCLAALAPIYFYSAVFPLFTAVIAASQVLLLHLAGKAVRKKRPESLHYLFGIVFFAGGICSDILAFLGVLNANYILPAVMTAFIASQISLIAKRYAESLSHAEQLSASLRIMLDKVMNAETAFLNAQIKPHFLYNTLNTIAQCCESDPGEAEELILSFSKYLRGTLDFENLGGIVPLSKELDLVMAYSSIERARFDNIGVEYNLGEISQQLQIPPLTLQPLVENAIKHGLRPKRGGGTVRLDIQKTVHGISFCVEDDGCGIPPEKLETILRPPEGSASIGLYNIHTRLIRLYGKGLNIESLPGSGTKVSFEVPCEEREICFVS